MMDNASYIQQKNLWLKKLDRDSRRHNNCLRFGDNEDEAHILAKVGFILQQKKQGEDFDFLTEVFSADRKFRADLIIFYKQHQCMAVVIEIAKNETKESLDKKEKFWMSKGFDYEVVR